MNGKTRFLVGTLSALGLLIATAAVAATAANAPETATIDACKKKKTAVVFAHAKHSGELGIACDKCHHTQKGLKAGGSEEVKTCASCHLNPEKADTPDCTSSSSKKNPYHITCMGCHKEEAKKDASKKDLKKCTTCHPK